MYSYDESTRTLKIQQIPEDTLELQLVDYQRRSYRRFCDFTIFDLLTSFIQRLEKEIGHKVKVVGGDADKNGFYLGTPPFTNWRREMRVLPDRYTPIMCDLDIDGALHKGVEIFRLPFMDEDAILNVQGERRVCTMQLTTADGLSYNGADRVSISVPMRNVTIELGTSYESVRVNRGKVKLADLVRMYCAKELPDLNLRDIFVSAPILSQLTDDANYASFAAALADRHIYEEFHKTVYELGGARESLNQALSLNRAVGRELSRKLVANDGTVLGNVGDIVTPDMIAQTRKHLVNSIYVKATPAVVGYKADTGIGGIILDYLPAGTVITDIIRPYLPTYMQGGYVVSKDIKYTGEGGRDENTTNVLYVAEDPIMLDTRTPITAELISLLASVGITSFRVARSGENWFDVTFEEEIIGNYTVQLRDVFGTSIPAGRSADEWVCFYNNPDLASTEEADQFLNAHDWIALWNLCDYIQRHPTEHKLVDKDDGMLKRVLGPNELFTKSFENCIDGVIRKNKRKWTQTANNAASMNIDLSTLFRDWKKEAWANHSLAAASYQNPVIHTQQVNVIDSATGMKEIPMAMRMLSTGYYGRICPYETPMGKRLGVTNTKAIGARIRDDGVLVTPYLMVAHEGTNESRTGALVTPTVRWLTVQEEVNYKIGDKLSLAYAKDGKHFSNTKVVARVPDGRSGHTIETVDSWDLDFVNFHSCQHLSSTSALQPFIGATESARMTLGAGMMKQSILVQHSEKPRVFTAMYHEMFKHSPTYCAFAKEAGVVTDILNNAIIVSQPPADYRHKFGYKFSDREVYDELQMECSLWPHQEYPISATTITRQGVNSVNYRVRPGQWVKPGDILYDSGYAQDGIYSPGCNFFVAYIPDGYNYEDAVEISQGAAARFTSISLETVDIKLPFYDDSQPFVVPYINHYVREGDVVAEFTKDGQRGPRYVARSGMHSGMVLNVSHDREERNGYTRYKAYMVAFNKLRVGDKLIGRHSNKGTASIVRKATEMPRFLNGQSVDVVLNPAGVPSRLNIGQNFEAYLGFIAYLLDIYVESDAFNGATKADIRELMHYVYDLANSGSADSVNGKYSHLPASLKSQGKARHAFIQQWAGCFNPDGTANLINPASGKPYGNPVTFGMPYMLKLEHEVTKKIKVRGGQLEEDYSKVYLQPTEGAARGGGERVGEMEFCALAAYGADHLMDESMNASSDNVIERLLATMKDVGLEDSVHLQDPSGYFDRSKAVPHSVEFLRYLLEVLGISMDASFLPSVKQEDAQARVIPDSRNILKRHSAEEGAVESNDVWAIMGGDSDD